MFKFFDSHSHLQFPAYDADRDSVVSRMKKDGVGTIIVGTNFNTSSAAISLADDLGDDFYSAIAVHPAHVFSPHHDKNEQTEPPNEEMFSPNVFATLLLTSKKIIAVGECGLDYFRVKDDPSFQEIRARQMENFSKQIAFGVNNKLPLIIHARDAHADTLAIMRDGAAAFAGGVMHCFSGTVSEAKEYLNLGFYISLTCAVTYAPRKNEMENPLHAVAKYVPLDRLLVETDSPYLPPAELRGARNEPANVICAVKKIAELRGENADAIAEATSGNAGKLFLLASSFPS
jgi:TatD DNase family protein